MSIAQATTIPLLFLNKYHSKLQNRFSNSESKEEYLFYHMYIEMELIYSDQVRYSQACLANDLNQMNFT